VEVAKWPATEVAKEAPNVMTASLYRLNYSSTPSIMVFVVLGAMTPALQVLRPDQIAAHDTTPDRSPAAVGEAFLGQPDKAHPGTHLASYSDGSSASPHQLS